MSNRNWESRLTLSTLRRPTQTRTREAARISPEAKAHVSCEGYAHRGTVIIDARVIKERADVMSHDQRHRYEWKAIPWRTREGRVCKLQRRIYQATTRGETQKARRLQKLRATSWSAKSLAVRRVTQDNQGKKTAGVDGGKSLTPPQRLHLISHMDLHTPAKPVRRVWIDKSGKPEQRPLGIPIMQARATQALVKLAFEPAWEAQFEPTSFGCRPGRSSQDAVQQIGETIKIQPRYVLDAAIASCFDRIHHAALLEKRHTSPHFARPLKEWLKAGVVDRDVLRPTEGGTPQGGVASPL